MKKTRNFGYDESDKRRKEFADLHELCEKIFCIPATTAPVERVFSTSGLSMQPHSARVGNKLLSELVMIKSNVKTSACLVASSHMFH